MANFREIVTKAVLGKGKKNFAHTNVLETIEKPTTILGCWVINHNFTGTKDQNKIVIDGSYDVNIWYSYENDTLTNVVKETYRYSETVNIRESDVDYTDASIIVRNLKNPTCSKVEITDSGISYTVENELGIELVGDTKVKIQVNDDTDEWEEIVEDESKKIDEEIDKNVNENYINEKS